MADKFLNLSGLSYLWSKILALIPGQATDNNSGLVKTNASKSISLNANGQLEVGGRLGQFPTSLGLFAPDDREPRQVSDYSLLITDAKGMTLGNRALALVSGLGVTCKSAPAGSTEYRVSNTYANRLLCKIAENGYASRDEATSKVEMTIPVVSVTINGSSYTPDSSANDSSNDIVIKTESTLNPDSAITSIRLFPIMSCYSTAHMGNGIASWGGGRNFLLGGGVIKDGSGNDNCVVSNGAYVNGNGNAVFGRYHVIRKNRGFFAGQGHDNTNATGDGVSAIGQYSNITANTMFAIGNGSNHTNRLNLLEVLKDGRAKISGTPTESDDLTPKAYVDSAVASAGVPDGGNTGQVLKKASNTDQDTIWGDIEGFKFDLLWTNPDDTTSFTAQTIPIDLSSYKLVLITFKLGNSIADYENRIAEIGVTRTALMAGPAIRGRTFTTSNSGVAFEDGYLYATYGSATKSNSGNNCIPCYIYGIK